ncbi:MAG TPA: sarcosine oxidase subunit delta [Steroidobacteraceae bacterium]|jgi:sarcosine oxidase subunit delta|nr:sarcosine oxidase subunit delta [Steroidobacteraceae bacterium]
MRLVCPFCGPRALREFVFHKTLPTTAQDRAYERTYERVASLENSVEHWQHVEGCRGWLLVQRNPSTGQVIDVRLLGAGAL